MSKREYILDYLNNPAFKNKIGLFHDALDTLEYCMSKHYFKNYPYDVTYYHNSRGFRDEEWPEDLTNLVWCLGDSFTHGMSVPLEFTWPYILQKRINTRCLNLGIDGNSNDFIAKMAMQIIENHNPKHIVIMWSFFHRRHRDPWNFIYFDQTASDEDNLNNFFYNFNKVNSIYPNITNLLVPGQPLSTKLAKEFRIFANYPVLDFGRDGFHFSKKTANKLVDVILRESNNSLLPA